MFKYKEAQEFKNLVTFLPNKTEPIHNWYWYKEGFSRGLVDYFLKKFQVAKTQTILDPFCGIGTTSLACKQSNIPSVGFDISPLFVFISKVKTADYNLQELGHSVKQALKWKFKKENKKNIGELCEVCLPTYIKRLFSKYTLEDITFYKNKISEIQNQEIKNFLLLALVDSAMNCSFAYKDGAFVRIRKGGLPPLKNIFKYKIKKMLKDLKNNPLPEVQTKIEIADASSIPLQDNSMDAAITSPPYLNKTEYTKIYRTEFSILGLQEPKSYFGGNRTCAHEDICTQVEAGENAYIKNYFKDMQKVLSELYRVCRPSARLAVVIGGGCFPNKVICTDEETAKIAEQSGFKINKILVARHLWCTRQKTIKIGKTSESIILMEK